MILYLPSLLIVWSGLFLLSACHSYRRSGVSWCYWRRRRGPPLQSLTSRWELFSLTPGSHRTGKARHLPSTPLLNLCAVHTGADLPIVSASSLFFPLAPWNTLKNDLKRYKWRILYDINYQICPPYLLFTFCCPGVLIFLIFQSHN